MAITLVLLVVGFIPPWMQLTSKMDRIVKAEMAGLRRRLASSEVLSGTGANLSQDAADLQARLDEALVMLRISYLERLHRRSRPDGGLEHRHEDRRARHDGRLLRAVHIFRTG